MKKDENNIKAIQITNFKRNKRKLNLKLAKRALRGLLGLAPLKYTADKTDSPPPKAKAPIKSYQFMINEPISSPSKKNPDVKKMLKKRGLSSDPEWSLSIFNHSLKEKG